MDDIKSNNLDIDDTVSGGPLPAEESPDGRVVGPGPPESSAGERQNKRDLVFKRHYRKSHLEKKLDSQLREMCPDGKLKSVVSDMVDDPLVASIQNYANVVSIQRLGYNDHGPVHARITAINSLKILELLNEGGVLPSIVFEEVGTMDDARVAVFLGAFLHDLGMAVTRDDHENHSMQMAGHILESHL